MKIATLAGKSVYGPLLDKDREVIDEIAKRAPLVDFVRASGDVICPVCGKEYYKHPSHMPHLFLTVLCNGKIVKL